MAGGFRVTEEGSQRVDETLQLRLTEEFFPLYAVSLLNAVGTVIPVGGILLGAVSTLISSGLNVSASTFTAGAVGYLSGTTTITPVVEHFKNFLANLNSLGEVTAKAGYLLDTSSGLSSVGTIGLLPDVIRYASAKVGGALVFTGVSQVIMNPQVTLGSTLTASVSGTLIAEGFTSVSSVGTIGANSELFLRGLCVLQADSVAIIYPQLIQAALSLVGSSGTVTAYGGFLANVNVTLNSLGTMNGTAYMLLDAIVSQDTNRRITEDGGIRIVSSGDFRTLFGAANLITSLTTVTPSIIPFAGSIYGKRSDLWGLVTPQIKHKGAWYIPKIYVNNNNTWKRVS